MKEVIHEIHVTDGWVVLGWGGRIRFQIQDGAAYVHVTGLQYGTQLKKKCRSLAVESRVAGSRMNSDERSLG